MDDDFESSFLLTLRKYGLVTIIGLIGIGLLLYGLMQYFIPRESSEVIFTRGQESQSVSSSAATPKTIVIDLSGAVVSPGLYSVSEESRVGEVVEMAGGFALNANKALIAREINLAQKLTDGMKLYIPFEGEEVVISTTSVLGSKDGLISMNTASAAQLDTLPGIGVQTAQKIISARPYSALEELTEKKVVSVGVFEKIRNMITL